MPPICMPTKERPVQVVWGDCLRVMSTLPPGCVDTVITDPPYHLTQASRGGSPRTPGTGPFGRIHLGERGFMGKTWDGGDIAFRPEVWAECMRVAKPGAFLLAFGSPRTWHRLACAIEDGGWEIRDTLCWLYGTGFPKAKSCLKPSWEPVILALKPSAHVPPLNIDGARIQTDDDLNGGAYSLGKQDDGRWDILHRFTGKEFQQPLGRWPANVVLSHHESCECRGTKLVRGSKVPGPGADARKVGYSGKGTGAPITVYTDADGMEEVEDWTCHQDCPVRLLDEQAGPLRARGNKGPTKWRESNGVWSAHGSSFGVGPDGPVDPGDSGGPSRFFYCSKASKTERWITLHCNCQTCTIPAWQRPDQSQSVQTATTSPKTDTCADGSMAGCDLSTLLSGSEPTGQCRLGGKSTTSIGTDKTTGSKTFESSPQQSTNGFMEGVSGGTGFGGNHALSADNENLSHPTTGTSQEKVGHSMVGAALVTLPESWQRNVCGKCGAKVVETSHPTVKPLALMRWLVRLVSFPGDLILDPFAGSGTTGLAAVQEGRRCLLVEKEQPSVKIIRSRLASMAPEVTSNGADNGR